MARTKISKIAKDLNISLSTAVEFLQKKDITVDDNPNARIDDDVVDILVKEFQTDKDIKSKSELFSSERAHQREKSRPAKAEPEEIKLPSEQNRLKILGKIELDKKGNPVHHKPEPAPAPEKAEVPTVQKPEPAPAPAPAPAPEVKETPAAPAPAPRPEPAPEAPAAEKPAAPAPAPVAEAPAAPAEKKAKEEPAPAPAKTVQLHNQPEQSSQLKTEPKTEEAEIFTLGLPKDRPTINVIGKIDLSSDRKSVV